MCLSSGEGGLAPACKIVITVAAWDREPGSWTDATGAPRRSESETEHPTRAQIITRIRERAAEIAEA